MRALLGISIGAAAILAAIGCGGSSNSGNTPVMTTGTPTPTPSGFVITIVGLRYSPLNLSVPPGATITVLNNDPGMIHSVTSEARVGAYTPGAVNGVSFNTGEFGDGTRAIQIAANAPAGTVIPYYCITHLTTMATPNGTITIDPNATPTSSPTTPTTPMPTPATPAPTGY
jgi:plastocyanin